MDVHCIQNFGYCDNIYLSFHTQKSTQYYYDKTEFLRQIIDTTIYLYGYFTVFQAGA